MKTSEIKTIMIVHNDNDFVRVWDWIGKVVLFTIKNQNLCGEDLLEDSEDIEKFIQSLLPTAIEFTQYRVDKYESYCRYENISQDEVKSLLDSFSTVRFKYNFDVNDQDWIFGGSETLIIDIDSNESYIR